MTDEEYIQKLKALRDSAAAKAVERFIIPNAQELLASVKNRIMLDGVNSSGAQIGAYSTKPMYASADQFVKKGAFKAVGKTGKKTKSTMYLPAGYKQLRDIQGRPTDKINENYSGDTMLAYQQQAAQGAVLQGMTTERASKIRQGQEKRFGKIFSPTQAEMQHYRKEVVEDVRKLIADGFR